MSNRSKAARSWQRQSWSNLSGARLKSDPYKSTHYQSLRVFAEAHGRLNSYDHPYTDGKARVKFVMLEPDQLAAKRKQQRTLPKWQEASECLFDACHVNTMPEPVAWPEKVPLQYGRGEMWTTRDGERQLVSIGLRTINAEAYARQYVWDRSNKCYRFVPPNMRKPKRIEPVFTDDAYLDRDVAKVNRQRYSGAWVHNARSKLKCDPGMHDMSKGPLPYDARARERAALADMVAAYQHRLAHSYVSYLTGGSAQ